jgi:hypothetical protein
MSKLSVAVILSSFLMLGCGIGSDGGTAPGPGPDPEQASYRVSECGGFAELERSEGAGYCGANRLDWTYDAVAGKLTLADKRVLLNCCGDHSVKVKQENGTYVITEIDAPEQGGGRCLCMCVYDFEVTIAHAGGGPISIEIERDVTDDSEPAETVFSGQLDLSAGSGSEVLASTDVSLWCESTSPQPPGPQPESAISSCGGFEKMSSGVYQPSDYCDAELLRWRRDPTTGEVTFVDQRVELNCCGDRSIAAANEGDVLVITVTDAPEEGGGRCRCTCVFDFAITLSGLSGDVPVKLVREITDDGEPPVVVYTGTLDLTADTGAVIVDQAPAVFCEAH